MPTTIVSTDIAGDIKPSFASSAIVGLTIRANGEEPIKVLTPNGDMYDAQIPSYNDDDHELTFSDDGAASTLPPNKWAAYTYVYASTAFYPNVENDISIGGSIAPRGNPNRQTPHQVDALGHGVTLHIPQEPRADIDQIWVFRTEFFDTAEEASLQAIAGQAFYLGTVPNDPLAAPATVDYLDENENGGTDLIEVDNNGVPTFRYVIYEDPYWWGWGNDPFVAQVDFASDGTITLLGGREWFSGRYAQSIRLEGVDSGGGDDHGTFYFIYTDATHAQAGTFDVDGVLIPTTIGSAASNKTIVIQGPSTTLYRSKYRNPFSWGQTEYFGSVRVPSLYAAKVGGGRGTGIAVIPNLPYLLLSTEFPAGAYTLDLRSAGTDTFFGSLRNISKFYSMSSHFSQFPAVRGDGLLVLWGWDAKNFCILECDGSTIRPVSAPVSKTLRLMSEDRSRQQLAHGAFDARNGLNCMWLPTANSLALVNLLVAQHAQSGQWFIHDEHDVLCSAQFQDGESNLSKIFLGTQSGFVGEAFSEGKYEDWLLPESAKTGLVTEATSTEIIAEDVTFADPEPAYIGSWCLLTDANGENEQWARISNCNVATKTLTFDAVYSELNGSAVELDPVPVEGWRFYIGLIEVRTLKYFDLQQPSADKKLDEIWLTIENVDTDTAAIIIGDGSTFLRYYRDRSIIPYAPLSDDLLGIPLNLVKFMELTDTETWMTQAPPTDLLKTFGIEIIDRAYKAWKMHNWVLKVK